MGGQDLFNLISMAASSMIIVGLIKPVKYYLIVIGSLIHCAQFIILALDLGFTVTGLQASTFFLPIHLWLCVAAFSYDRS